MHVRRVPRQRDLRAAGRRRDPVHAARELAAPADLPGAGDGLQPDRGCRDRRRRRCWRSTSSARLGLRVAAARGGATAAPAVVDGAACASASTSAAPSRRPSPSSRRRRVIAHAVVPTTHDADAGVAAGVGARCGAGRGARSARRRASSSSRTRPPRRSTRCSRATSGRRRDRPGPAARPAQARSGRAWTTSSWRRPRARHRARVPRRHRRPGPSASPPRSTAAGGAGATRRRQRSVRADDATRRAPVAALRAAGLPACASTRSGLYGLELRAVTAAINASILPIAITPPASSRRASPTAGDRRAGDGDARRRRRDNPPVLPARPRAHACTPGPAASRRLRFTRSGVTDGVVVEIGGTSHERRRRSSAGDRSSPTLQVSRRPHRAARGRRAVSSASPAARMRAPRSGAASTASGPAAPTSPGWATRASPTPEARGRHARRRAARRRPRGLRRDRAASTGDGSVLTNTCAAQRARPGRRRRYARGLARPRWPRSRRSASG